MTFRCSAAARDRGDDRAGTASTVRTFLLVEHSGPWGVNAWRDARLPEGLGVEVLRRSGAARIRPLLARTGERSSGGGVRVLAAHAGGSAPWAEALQLDAWVDVLDLDLDSIGRGERPGWEPVTDPVLAVCTHGKHDACCAERGRPVAAALRAAGRAVWEVSHIGGDRFAGNLVVLPHGFYYGGLDDDAGLRVAEAHAHGRLDLDHLRGRSAYAMPVQYAEIALRRHLGETRIGAVRLRHRHPEGDVFHTEFEHEGGGRWRVLVHTTPGEPGLLTCRAARPDPVPVHEVLVLERVAG